MLYTGQKRWLMAPPARRLTSNAHLTDWITSAATGDEIECIQNTGDIMYVLLPNAPIMWRIDLYLMYGLNVIFRYVPHLWAHGVANIQSSVALATEFSDCDLDLARAFGWI